jgi:S-adenosylmethionine synthetase
MRKFVSKVLLLSLSHYFDLKKPIYKKTAAYGNFGRSTFHWEKIIKLN